MENVGTKENYIAIKQDAEIREIKYLENKDTDNCIRIYRSYCGCGLAPDGFIFQIRTFKPANYNQDGKPKHMMAQIHFTLDELRELLAAAEEQSWKEEIKNA